MGHISGVELWRAAMRWRRRVNRELASLGLTLTQWLVLDALGMLVEETGDAVDQHQVGQIVELDKATISQVMYALSLRGLVDRGPDWLGRVWRIYLTNTGKAAVSQGRTKVEAIRIDAGLARALSDSAAWPTAIVRPYEGLWDDGM